MTERARVFGAFDQGQTPTIACFNQAKTPLGLDLKKLVPALQEFVDTCVVPVWGTPANLVESTGFIYRAPGPSSSWTSRTRPARSPTTT